MFPLGCNTSIFRWVCRFGHSGGNKNSWMQLLLSRGAQKTILLVLCFYTDLAGLPSRPSLLREKHGRIKISPPFPRSASPCGGLHLSWNLASHAPFNQNFQSLVKKQIDLSLAFSHPPGKEGDYLLCVDPPHPWGMLGHLLNTFPNQPCSSVGSAWLVVLAMTVNSDDRSLPAGAVRSQGEWLHALPYPASVPGKMLGDFFFTKI